METISKAYLLVVLCSFLYVQSVWSAAKTPLTSVSCTADANCTKLDEHAMCNTSPPKNCTCKSDYKINGDRCAAKVLNDSCGKNEDCVHVLNATCDTKKCNCSASFKVNGAACAKRVLNDSCGKNEDCVHVLNATCDTSKCNCVASFKVNGAACAKRVIGDPCTQTSDCPSHAECKNKICSCGTGYTAENGHCLFGVGTNCTKKMECVSNADCDVKTKKCTCSSGFSASNKLCAKQSSADSVKKTINAIVVSFLCVALLTII